MLSGFAAALLAETSLERVSERNPSILVIATLTGGRSESGEVKSGRAKNRKNGGRRTRNLLFLPAC